MNRQDLWLFETPSVQSPSYANSEYKTYSTPLEQEWEILGGPAYTSPLTEEEWEVNPIRRPGSRSRQPIRRSTTRQRRPVMPRQQQRRAPVAQRQFRQSVPSGQGQGIEAESMTLIATIDGFEFGS